MKSQLEIDKMKKQLNKYRNLIKKAQLSRDNRWRLRYLVDKAGAIPFYCFPPLSFFAGSSVVCASCVCSCDEEPPVELLDPLLGLFFSAIFL